MAALMYGGWFIAVVQITSGTSCALASSTTTSSAVRPMASTGVTPGSISTFRMSRSDTAISSGLNPSCPHRFSTCRCPMLPAPTTRIRLLTALPP
jgi:hypothetical protein